MSHSEPKHSRNAVSRRGFLAVGGVGLVGLSLSESLGAKRSKSNAVIQIVLNGGASHLETFDPKPEAPREIRGPVHSIATAIPGVQFSESLPKLAQRANDLVILRSLHHDAAPIHETGMQLLLAGRLANRQSHHALIGSVFSQALKPRGSLPVAVRVGSGRLGGEVPTIDQIRSEGQSGFIFESDANSTEKRNFGKTRFGELMWTAVKLVEAGVKYVEVHTFDDLHGQVTWDAHGCSETAPGTIFDYRDTLGPQFDKATAAMTDRLQQSGLWKQTLVVCTGEMGRTPRINEQNGRDHWPHVWSGFLGGGGMEGGQVIGASDPHGESIEDHPTPISHLPGLICAYLGIEGEQSLAQSTDQPWVAPVAKLS